MNPVATGGVPDGFVAIPIHGVSEEVPLRLAVLVRRTPDPVAGHFVLLRELPDASVYLGCLTDAASRVREWIELWIQNVDGLEAALPAQREAFSNLTLDERWAAQAEALAHLDPAGALITGWESRHPRPLFIDLAHERAQAPTSDDGAVWELCRDDQALEAASLPTYRRSLVRYLWQPQAGINGSFVPATAGAPTNERTLSLNEIASTAGHLPLNPQGGLISAAAFSPLSWEDYVDLLGGKAWKGLEQGKKTWVPDGVYATLADREQMLHQGHHLWLGGRGKAGRFTEMFHLKLQLLVDAVRTVRTCTERLQLPFLNLGADSLRVRLNPVGAGLPLLWTARVSLAKPSEAHALPVQSTEARYFIRAGAGGTSIYLPEGISQSLRGTGSVRLRQVGQDEGQTVVEGTLVLQERHEFSPHDLFWIRLPLSIGRIDLYGHLYSAESLARGEVRFRTVPHTFPDPVVKALKAAEGAAFPRSPFEVVPMLSSPCDLYSLGVLAVRTFLVNDQNTLAVALDELLSLARQVASEHRPEVPIGQRVREVLENDARFLDALGPNRLVHEPITPQEAFAFVPEPLWYDLLGRLIGLFPGAGPDSACKDFGDVPPLALESVYNRPLADLEALLVRARSLIVIDWQANREIQSIITDAASRAG